MPTAAATTVASMLSVLDAATVSAPLDWIAVLLTDATVSALGMPVWAGSTCCQVVGSS